MPTLPSNPKKAVNAPERMIDELLVDLFANSQDLAAFLRSAAYGEEVLKNVPDPRFLSIREFVARVTVALDRRAWIDDDFFNDLALQRPGRREDIDRVRAAVATRATSSASGEETVGEETVGEDAFGETVHIAPSTELEEAITLEQAFEVSYIGEEAVLEEDATLEEHGSPGEEAALGEQTAPTEQSNAAAEGQGPVDLLHLDPRHPRLRDLSSADFDALITELLRRTMGEVAPAPPRAGYDLQLTERDSGALRAVVIRQASLWHPRQRDVLRERLPDEGRTLLLVTSSALASATLTEQLAREGFASPRVLAAHEIFELLAHPEAAGLGSLVSDDPVRDGKPDGKTEANPDGRPAYATDAVPDEPELLEDRLGRTREVEILARLLASREVEPPLSVGLLGDWGVGKSYFMGLLQKRLTELAREAREAKADRTTCQHIAHVRFNAWHYSDTDLWSSLVGHLFTELAREMAPEKAPVQAQRQLLEQHINLQKGVLAQQKETVSRARRLVEELRGETARARRALQLDRLLSQNDDDLEALRTQANNIGWVRALDDALETREAVRLVQEGRWRFMLNGLGQHYKKPLGIFTLGLVVLLALAIVFPLLEGRGGDATLWAVWGAALQMGATLVAGVTAIREAGKPVDAFIQSGRATLRAADAALAAQDTVPAKSITELDAWLSRRQQVIADSEASLARLEEQHRDLDPREGLRRFIAGRADHYEQRRGIVTLVRQDLEELSSNMRTYRQALARGDAEAVGKATENAVKSVTVEVTRDGSTTQQTFQAQPMERIVLYIDDLDRCEPKQVVEVLQAVHMLLGFDLFVVVVAVDPRWLLSSLRVVYKDIFEAQQQGGLEDSTTPMDYLEKIFQVPLKLRPMGQDGFRGLVEKLTEARARVEGGATPGATSHAPEPTPTPGTEPQGAAGPAKLPAARTPATSGPGLTPGKPASKGDAAVKAAPPTPPTSIVLELDETEKSFLSALHGFVPSGRAAKRLINVYRFVRALLAEPGSAPLRDEDREALLVLLAVGVMGDGAWTRLQAHLVEIATTQSLANLAQMPDPGLKAAFASLQEGAKDARFTSETLKRWSDLASRFSFQSAIYPTQSK